MTNRRILWQILPQVGVFRWKLLMDGESIRSFFTQKGAITEARLLARFEWDTQRRPSEIQIHERETGKIREKDTYPRSSDPQGED